MTPIDSRGESKMQRSTASMKKALGGDANKHRACGAQNFSPRRNLQTQFGEDRCTQFRVIVVTDPQTQTHPPTHRQDRLQYTASQIDSAQCKYK